MNKTLWIILGVALVVLGYVWMTYNGLVTGSALVDNQWKQVEVQYQRRLDLIPNLVESVKGIMKQETATLTLVTDARTKYMNAATTGDKVTAANELESAVGKFLVLAENYPQLRSVEAVLSMQAELAGTENRVAVERMRYNDNVTSFNLMTKRFPSNMIASMFGFEQAVYFNAEKGAENVPKVQL
ncbi:MAG TPA: LemA family protein [Candidatus Paceibacterota bacterium]|nr:LemA family protein [Candidatus Paceibacterota bacterium]